MHDFVPDRRPRLATGEKPMLKVLYDADNCIVKTLRKELGLRIQNDCVWKTCGGYSIATLLIIGPGSSSYDPTTRRTKTLPEEETCLYYQRPTLALAPVDIGGLPGPSTIASYENLYFRTCLARI